MQYYIIIDLDILRKIIDHYPSELILDKVHD